jgi:glutaredoxin
MTQMPPPRVTLYTKPECGLCDEVKEVIEIVRRRRPFEVELRNILENLDEYEKYKHDIPVILLDGVEIARHRMTEEQLEFALQSRRLQ